MLDIVERAARCFTEGYNCCQAVLLGFCGPLGLGEELAARLGTGFGLGMARGGTCGAVSGAVLVLGLCGGGGGSGGAAAKAATYARVRYFYDRFIERHGALVCRDLLGLDPTTPQGLEQAVREDRFHRVCLPLVRDVASLARDIAVEAGLCPACDRTAP
ncbi:MAG: C-GCAxxG-C-C family protein [Solidesulfovibrio sp. DCME]|uniref:C-GCAxxG-C-C family protein n=1 Tax=Solidesulfovibrio sp. DCME TaxID=3447380 RepID=UPI003D1141A1